MKLSALILRSILVENGSRQSDSYRKWQIFLRVKRTSTVSPTLIDTLTIISVVVAVVVVIVVVDVVVVVTIVERFLPIFY